MRELFARSLHTLLLATRSKKKPFTPAQHPSASPPPSALDAFALEDRVMMSATPLDPNLQLDDHSTDVGDANGLADSGAADWGLASDFSTGESGLFSPRAGSWEALDDAYQGRPSSSLGDAIALLDPHLPSATDLALSVTANAGPATGNLYSNAFIIFDYQDANNFKFAGGYTGNDQWVIGHRSASGWKTDASVTAPIEVSTDYRLTLTLGNDSDATLYVNGVAAVAYSFADSLTDGALGLGTRNAVSHFDDFLLTSVTLDHGSTPGSTNLWDDFDDALAEHLSPQQGSWSLFLGHYVVTPDLGADGVSSLNLADELPADLELSVTMNHNDFDSLRFSNGFIIFDYQSPTDFKFAGAFAARDEWAVGHRTADDWVTDAVLAAPIDPYADYNVTVRIEDAHHVTLTSGDAQVEHTFADDVTDGALGLGTYNAVARFDNLKVVDLTPKPAATPVLSSVTAEQGRCGLHISADSAADIRLVAVAADTFELWDHGQLISTHADFSGTLHLNLSDNDDNVTLDLGGYDILHSVTVDLGDGTNHLHVVNGSLDGHLVVHGGTGDDAVEIASDVHIEKHAKIKLGSGDDQVLMSGEIGRSLWVKGGPGDDLLDLDGTVHRHLFARMGNGYDQADIDEHASIGRWTMVALGSGQDVLPTHADHRHEGPRDEPNTRLASHQDRHDDKNGDDEQQERCARSQAAQDEHSHAQGRSRRRH